MTTKITLEIDRALLQKAERWAQQQKLSLSDVISNFLRLLPEPNLIPQDEHPLAKFAGILSDSEAQELQQAIATEFEQIDTNKWQCSLRYFCCRVFFKWRSGSSGSGISIDNCSYTNRCS